MINTQEYNDGDALDRLFIDGYERERFLNAWEDEQHDAEDSKS